MKVIFLDIDGVLNCIRTVMASSILCKKLREHRIRYSRNDLLHQHICPQRVERLNRITSTTGAVIVLSSSWRGTFGLNLQKIQRFFRRAGVKAEIIDQTPWISTRGARREDEIRLWLKENPCVETFVILDDDSFADTDLAPYSVKTVYLAWNGGLRDAHVAEAVRILNKKEGQ